MNKSQDFIFFVMAVLSAPSIVLATTQTNSKDVSITKCFDYLDKREFSTHINQNIVSIPFSRSSQQAYSYDENLDEVSFTITIKEYNLGSRLKCSLENSEIRNVIWNISDADLWDMQPRNFHNVTIGSSERHQHSYFTESGYFYDSMTGNYYNPTNDYCVHTISDEDISLRICPVNMDCSNSNSRITYCLPKCCALDETLLFWRRQCARLPETVGIKPWQPPVYQSAGNPDTKVDLRKSLIYHMTELPKNCSLFIHEDGTIEEFGYEMMSAVHVKHPKNQDESVEKEYFKLSLPNGNGGKLEILTFDSRRRKWMVAKIDNFCVDGFHVKSNNTPIYTGKEDNFVIFFCMNDGDESDLNEEAKEQKTWMYVSVSLISLLFLLATLIIYVFLWEKHNLHGLTIASYIGSMCGAYLFFTIAHTVYLYPNSKFTGVHDRGLFCYTIASLAHYFYLSCYFWLTVMNLDLWMTLSSMRAVRRDSKEWIKFGIYSGIGWVLPIFLIIAFVVIDYKYRDPFTRVPVVNYAQGSCFVSVYFRVEYVFAPMAILLGVNLLLIAMTMWIFLKARCRNSNSTSEGNLANRYDLRLFVKLFIVMGGTSLIEFVTWIYNEEKNKPWIIVVLEAISYLVPVIYFFLFCLNDKVVGQLREKFPRFTEKIEPVLKLFVKDNRKRYTFDDSTASTNKTRVSAMNAVDKSQDGIQLKRLVRE